MKYIYKKFILIIAIIFFSLFQNNLYSQCWKEIIVGGDSRIGIKNDNTLWAWGNNTLGELGFGNTNAYLTPTQVGISNDWKKVSMGVYHSLAIKNDGTLWACGLNDAGQLGDGTTINKISFIQIGSDNDWLNISGGNKFSLATKLNGTLWAWGDNNFGQLGDGTLVNKLTPTQIGIATDWTTIIATANNTSFGYRSGNPFVWGKNENAIYGDGTYTQSYSPVYSINYYDPLMAISSYSGVMIHLGKLYQWGDNLELAQNNPLPVQIGTETNWSVVKAGYRCFIAKKLDGTLWSWGLDVFGSLGLGVTNGTVVLTPTQIGTDTNWDKIYFDGYGGFATKTDGTNWVWGWNQGGALGDGTIINKNIPTLISCNNLSLEELNYGSDVTVYPNPTNDVLNINSKTTILSADLSDLNGRKILSIKPNSIDFKINLDSFDSGIYLLKTYSDSGSSIQKIIKK